MNYETLNDALEAAESKSAQFFATYTVYREINGSYTTVNGVRYPASRVFVALFHCGRQAIR